VSPAVSETCVVKHITRDLNDVPAGLPMTDRRRTPDQRREWRGGRRDSDWVGRPPAAWSRYTGKPAAWRQVLSTLHIFNL
jgi:hypothetical protein